MLVLKIIFSIESVFLTGLYMLSYQLKNVIYYIITITYFPVKFSIKLFSIYASAGSLTESNDLESAS